MAFNKQQVLDHITTVDSWISINDTLGNIKIRELIAPLIDSINDDGAVSYVIGKNERYRSSTLATVLDALCDVNLLPRSAIYQMQDHLYSLRNKFVPYNTGIDDVIDPDQEDIPAWGRDEAPSVWTTSKAIIALMSTDYLNRDNIITNKNIRSSLRASVYWLANQAYSDGGWGYQNYPQSRSCQSNVPMTALAMKALILAQRNDSLFNQDARTSRSFHNLTHALTAGADYLLREKKEEDGKVYWEYNDEPGVAITMWAIETLDLLSSLRAYTHLRVKYDEIAPKAIKYVFDMLPDQDMLEGYKQSELFFKATNQDGALKYKASLRNEKCFYTFKPYIVSSLLDRGEDPTDPKIVAMVRWLLSNRDARWAISEYNSSSPCSISAAMAINVIVKWLMKMSVKSFSTSVNSLINDTNSTTCQYGLPCDKLQEHDSNNVTKYYLLPTFAAVVLSFVALLLFPDNQTYLIASWFASAILFAFLISLPVGQKLLNFVYGKRKDILWEILVAIILAIISYFATIVISMFQLIMQSL